MSVQRLQGLYRTAYPDERSQGLLWYPRANEEVIARTNTHNLTPRVVAGVMAALSPNTKWETTLRDTDHLLAVAEFAGTGDDLIRNSTVSTYSTMKMKAIRILRGEQPEDVLNGPRSYKVPVFFRNLLGDWSEPCIDSHAINAWHGRRVAGSDLSLRKVVSTVRLIRADYIRAARARKLTPAEFQAIVWITWKRRIAQGKVPGYQRSSHDPEHPYREEG